MNNAISLEIADGLYVIGGFKYKSLNNLLHRFVEKLKSDGKNNVQYLTYKEGKELFSFIDDNVPLVLFFENQRLIYKSQGLNFNLDKANG